MRVSLEATYCLDRIFCTPGLSDLQDFLSIRAIFQPCGQIAEIPLEREMASRWSENGSNGRALPGRGETRSRVALAKGRVRRAVPAERGLQPRPAHDRPANDAGELTR